MGIHLAVRELLLLSGGPPQGRADSPTPLPPTHKIPIPDGLRAAKMRRGITEIRHDAATGPRGARIFPHPDRVACCVASGEARDIAIAAARRCASDAVVMTPDELLSVLRHGGPWAALIYDLGPRNGSGVTYAAGVRREHPELPILLYAPASAGVADSLLRCGALTGVRAELQGRVPAEGVERLHTLLTGLLAERPRARVLQMLRAVAPAAPPRAWAFAEQALTRLSERRGPTTCRVSSLARDLGASQRTLEREWHATALPPPKEFLDWVALLLAVVTAASTRTTVAQAAHHLRIHSRHLYRLRRRLVPGQTRIPSLLPEQECDGLLLALIERCRGIQAALRANPPSAAIA